MSFVNTVIRVASLPCGEAHVAFVVPYAHLVLRGCAPVTPSKVATCVWRQCRYLGILRYFPKGCICTRPVRLATLAVPRPLARPVYKDNLSQVMRAATLRAGKPLSGSGPARRSKRGKKEETVKNRLDRAPVALFFGPGPADSRVTVKPAKRPTENPNATRFGAKCNVMKSVIGQPGLCLVRASLDGTRPVPSEIVPRNGASAKDQACPV